MRGSGAETQARAAARTRGTMRTRRTRRRATKTRACAAATRKIERPICEARERRERVTVRDAERKMLDARCAAQRARQRDPMRCARAARRREARRVQSSRYFSAFTNVAHDPPCPKPRPIAAHCLRADRNAR